MNKYKLLIFDRDCIENFFNKNIPSVVVYAMPVLIIIFFFSLIFLAFSSIYLKKEITQLKNYEPSFQIDRATADNYIRDIGVYTGKLKDTDHFTNELFKIPFISNYYDHSKLISNTIAPRDIIELLLLDSTKDTVSLNHLKKIASLLQEQTQRRINNYKIITQHLREQDIIFAHTPSIWPSTQRITSHFGFRRSPFTGSPTFHEGTDFGAITGTPNKSAADGIVVFAGVRTGYGYLVTVDHGFGYMTRYAHNSSLLVKAGDFVKKGDILALAGATGRAAGPHLHFEILYNGTPLNASKFLPPVKRTKK